MNRAVRAVLVTHGRLGTELLETAESILGRQDRVAVLSNTGLSAAALSQALAPLISGEEPTVLFVDLGGGSCGQICSLARRDRESVLVAQGVNLPMLLEFFHYRGRVELEELRRRLVTRGREGIACFGWGEEMGE